MSGLSRSEQEDVFEDAQPVERLLPIVYEELRQLAAARLNHEKAGNSFQATALVNEAFLRLVEQGSGQKWNSKGHFFGAASIAMRRILVERARRNKRIKHGGDRQRIELSAAEPEIPARGVDLLALDEALPFLEQHDPRAYKVVHLRFFAGLTISQTAKTLDVSKSTVENDWSYAKAWLKSRLNSSEKG